VAQASRMPGLDVEAFYPVSEDEADAVEAKAICDICPVRQACLEHALAHREREGIWGGTTEGRPRIVRQRRNQPDVVSSRSPSP